VFFAESPGCTENGRGPGWRGRRGDRICAGRRGMILKKASPPDEREKRTGGDQREEKGPVKKNG